MKQVRNILYDNNRFRTVLILLIVSCLTTNGFTIRKKREAPAEAAPAAADAAKVAPAAEAAKVAPAAEAAKAAPGPPPPAPAANPISGPMNAAAAQMTSAIEPFVAHMDKLGTEGAEVMTKGFKFASDFMIPWS